MDDEEIKSEAYEYSRRKGMAVSRSVRVTTIHTRRDSGQRIGRV
jgi:hypothetical protein